MSERATFVHDEGDLRKYRTETPNMVLDMDLDPYAGWLYTHIKRIAGDRGVCDGGTRTLARMAGMSPGQVSKCKRVLKEKGLIRVVEHPRQSGLSDEIYVVNIWRRNFEHFDASEAVAMADGGGCSGADRGPEGTPAGTRSQDEHHPVHHMNTAQTACSCDEHPPENPHDERVHLMNTPFMSRTPCSPHEHKKEPIAISKETSPDGDAKKPAEGTCPATSARHSPRRKVKRLTDEEAERRWEDLCEADPHGADLRKLAELLAAENSTGAVAITRVWNELGDRYLAARARHELSEEAWAFGFDRAIARPAPNIGYVLKAAGGHAPGRKGRPGSIAVIGATDDDYREEEYRFHA